MGALRKPEPNGQTDPVTPQLSLVNSDSFVLPPGSTAPHWAAIAPFVPARGMANCHAQTLAGTLFPARPKLTGTTQRKLRLEDDDFVVLHDDRPAVWERGEHVALLLHGLAGCHQSGYMMRAAAKLHQRGVRTFRMDHRGCGAGVNMARKPYHAGRTTDLDSAVRMIERLCPNSPISIAGYSLSGNMLLKYLGEQGSDVSLSLFRAVAICPPVDLIQCMDRLNATRIGQRYDFYFTRRLLSDIADGPMWRDDLPLASLKRLPRRLFDFDDVFTAPASGFESAEDYYRRSSSKDFIGDIRVHTTILAAEDDPLICSQSLKGLSLPTNVQLCLTRHGGHLGFIGRRGIDPDRRWMDWRVIEWLLD